ncbi:MAG TPA: hypothetical protein ENK66_02160, partial [Arcobacter sp.]|nr:hypothetical protein [Arcobacter sp.]
MTKALNFDYHSLSDLRVTNNGFMYHNQGIDTIQLVAKYETVIKMIQRLGLEVKPMPKSNKVFQKIHYEIEEDSKKRLKKELFSPIVEKVDLPKVNPKDKALYISLVRNTPYLFEVATHHKKAKDT